MPKTTGTRKQKANELLEKLRKGPAISDRGLKSFTRHEAMYQVHLWLDTWIIPEVEKLIPELKNRDE